MKANEFRLGNLIKSENEVFPVTMNEFRAFSFPGVINEYDPIPLTEEWLLKFGFEKTLINNGVITQYFHDCTPPRYRNNYFDRLLSNQFSVSGKENNEGVKDDGKFYLSPYIRGVITRVTFPDLRNLYIQAFIGRTSNTAAGVVNQSSPPGILDTLNLFPALNYMLRVGRPFAIRGTKANASLSYLGKKGYVDAVLGPIDNSAFVALDVDFDFKKYFKISHFMFPIVIIWSN